MADVQPSPMLGFTEGPSPISGPSQHQRRYRRAVGGPVLVGLAALAVIAVLAAGRIGQRDAANARPGGSAVRAPTGGISRSGAGSSSAPGLDSATAASRRRGLRQASVIAGYLTRSRQARHDIGRAINAISGCTNITSAVRTLLDAADVRTSIVTALASTHINALPHGAAAVADLRRAMRTSASADRHYAAWGQAVANCRGHPLHGTEFAAAQRSDTAATAIKQRFADEWNPIAARYGLARQNANTF